MCLRAFCGFVRDHHFFWNSFEELAKQRGAYAHGDRLYMGTFSFLCTERRGPLEVVQVGDQIEVRRCCKEDPVVTFLVASSVSGPFYTVVHDATPSFKELNVYTYSIDLDCSRC